MVTAVLHPDLGTFVLSKFFEDAVLRADLDFKVNKISVKRVKL